MPTEEFDIANHLNEGNTQFKLFTGSSLLNLNDERLTGLVDEEILQEIKVDTDLSPFELSKVATTLLAKIGESVSKFADIGFNNNDTKEIHDVDKLASTCKKSIDYIAATTDLTPPIPEYVVRYYDT